MCRLTCTVVWGLENGWLVQVKAPRIKESACQLECKLKFIYDTVNK